MVLLEDTRQQAGKHDIKHARFEAMGITVRRSKLYVGDYMLASGGSRCVDTKESVLELLSDIHKQHDRFRDECIRAQEAGISILVLVEEELPMGKLTLWKSPCKGKKPISQANMETVRKVLITMTEKYGVQFRFCHPWHSAQKIMDYLLEGKL